MEPVPRTTTITQKPLSLRELIGNPKEPKLPEQKLSEEFLGQIYAQRDQLRTLPHPELLQFGNRLEKLRKELPKSEQTFFEKWFFPDGRARMRSLLKRCMRAVYKINKNYKIQIYNSGSKHEGYWNKNKRDGYGVFTHASGVTISGEWSNNFFTKPSNENMGNPVFISNLIGNPIASRGPNGFASTVLESYALELSKTTTESADKTWLDQCSSVMHQANQMSISAPQPAKLLTQIRNLPEKGSLTLNYISVGHAMVLQISKHGNELKFSIYNSGEGLERFHESKKFGLKTKNKTVKTFRIPLKEADIELVTGILMSRQKSTYDAYALFSSRALPDVSSHSVLDSSKNLTELWQSCQKSGAGNCQLECWMAWLKNTAPSLHAYTRFRKRFFELALEKSKQDPEMLRLSREKPELANAMRVELERKIHKRETKTGT